MTIFDPASMRGLFATSTSAAEVLWEADKLAAIWKASNLYNIVIQIATPAVVDQGKIWFQPDGANAAPGVFKYWDGTAWTAISAGAFATLAARFNSSIASSATNVASLVCNLPAGYTNYKFSGIISSISGGFGGFGFRFRTKATAIFRAGGSDYAWTMFGDSSNNGGTVAGAGSTTQSYIPLGLSALPGAKRWNFEGTICNPGVAAAPTQMSITAMGDCGGGTNGMSLGCSAGELNTSEVNDQISITCLLSTFIGSMSVTPID